MRVLVETDSDELHEQLRADSRGRITLGSDYAGETVSVAVVGRDADIDRESDSDQ
jgi:hypothetical protein